MSVSGDWVAAMTQTQTEKHKYRHTDTQARRPARVEKERECVCCCVRMRLCGVFSCAVCVSLAMRSAKSIPAKHLKYSTPDDAGNGAAFHPIN